MKSVFSWWTTRVTVISTLLILLSGNSTQANDPGACFMTTEDGRTINLGSLCGITPVKPVDTGVYRIDIKRRSGNTPIVDVTFNGKQTFEMIFDTGASGTLITQSMANALQIKPSGTLQASIADGSVIKLKTGQVKSIGVGGAKVNNVRVAIAPNADTGLLGHDFFGNYDVKIRQNTIELYRR
ncbi:putative aspartyl protease [Rivularia sp. PCC 7116]|uniref:retropepsin-like aspartic protease family protein n=1 Tax=Rivularia sp. PCC 7116 TaxID=373994 RepID=UPI00029F3F88|nr:retropepsin-like aspartic protease [Rivularia sp. PCC 7116]AFY56474.1 putative aspartyl protease [Rivularia sp. PCC 7116]